MSKRYSAVHLRERAHLRRRTRVASLVMTVKRARPRTRVSERGRLRNAVGTRDAAGRLTGRLFAVGTRGSAPNGSFRPCVDCAHECCRRRVNATRPACRKTESGGPTDGLAVSAVAHQPPSRYARNARNYRRTFRCDAVSCNAGQPASSLYLACRSPAWYRPRPKATN